MPIYLSLHLVVLALMAQVLYLVIKYPDVKNILYGTAAIGFWVAVGVNAYQREYDAWTGYDLAMALWFTVMWWRNRRKGNGKKAAKQVGDKSRQLIRNMVRKMSRSPIPSPQYGERG